jgi:hypothetical protein
VAIGSGRLKRRNMALEAAKRDGIATERRFKMREKVRYGHY